MGCSAVHLTFFNRQVSQAYCYQIFSHNLYVDTIHLKLYFDLANVWLVDLLLSVLPVDPQANSMVFVRSIGNSNRAVASLASQDELFHSYCASATCAPYLIHGYSDRSSMFLYHIWSCRSAPCPSSGLFRGCVRSCR